MAFTALKTILANRAADATPDEKRRDRNLWQTVLALLIWLFASAPAVLLYAIGSSWSPGPRVEIIKKTLEVVGAASLVGLACLAMGSLVGFLFGIPRTVQAPAAATGGSNQATATPGGTGQEVNTNLEQISDWLTKILVGVGLTQLSRVPDELWRFANIFAPTLPPSAALALTLNFLVVGFFLGYLLTRLFLAGAFLEASRTVQSSTLTEKAEQLERSGQYSVALATFEGAIEHLSPDVPKVEKKRAFEGAVFNALYEPPPVGFEKAIEYGERYIQEEPNTPSALIWAYLAAAQGQKFKYETAQGHPQEAAEARAKALEGIRHAIEISPTVRALIVSMWDPNSSLKSPGDDDLEVFFNDAEFKSVLAGN